MALKSISITFYSCYMWYIPFTEQILLNIIKLFFKRNMVVFNRQISHPHSLYDFQAQSLKAWVRKLVHFQDNKWVNEKFHDVCSIMGSQINDHGYGYPWRYTRDGSVISGVFKNNLGLQNHMTSCFQTHLDSVGIIMMDASLKTHFASVHSTSLC